MIEAWNAVVLPGDLVYHLGDFALTRPERAAEIAGRLRGQKYLIFGNHDKVIRNDKEFLSKWIWAKDLHQIEVQGQKITLCHYAMRTWNQAHRGAWQLHGHSHGSLKDLGYKQIDVGVDCWGFKPISFEEIKEKMSTRFFDAVDHHEEV